MLSLPCALSHPSWAWQDKILIDILKDAGSNARIFISQTRTYIVDNIKYLRYT